MLFFHKFAHIKWSHVTLSVKTLPHLITLHRMCKRAIYSAFCNIRRDKFIRCSALKTQLTSITSLLRAKFKHLCVALLHTQCCRDEFSTSAQPRSWQNLCKCTARVKELCLWVWDEFIIDLMKMWGFTRGNLTRRDVICY